MDTLMVKDKQILVGFCSVKLKDEYGLEVEKCAVIVIYNVSRYIDK
jgi:hypothetical protein